MFIDEHRDVFGVEPVTSVEHCLLVTEPLGWVARPVPAMARRSPRPGSCWNHQRIVVCPGDDAMGAKLGAIRGG